MDEKVETLESSEDVLQEPEVNAPGYSSRA